MTETSRTPQEQFWISDFGVQYLKRNYLLSGQLDAIYLKKFGRTRSQLNMDFLNGLPINNILEIGSNVGNQLALLQSQGFGNLYGIDVFEKAVEASKHHTRNINIIQGSAFDVPFKDKYFDLVFTSGLLIHISPEGLPAVMSEIYRVSKSYIWGYEYFSESSRPLIYRNNDDCLWCNNFVGLYLKLFPNLALIKQRLMPFKEIGLKIGKNGQPTDQNLVATMFIFKK